FYSDCNAAIVGQQHTCVCALRRAVCSGKTSRCRRGTRSRYFHCRSKVGIRLCPAVESFDSTGDRNKRPDRSGICRIEIDASWNPRYERQPAHRGPTAAGRVTSGAVPNPFFGVIDRVSSLGDPTITRSQLLKPFPRFTTVSFFRNNVGNANYHAFQVKFEKRLSHGLALLASYTRSKLIDEASSVFDAAILTGPVADFPVADSFNRRLERDVSAGDIPNVLAASVTYEAPRGWQLAGILTLQSGVPLPVSQSTNFNAFAGFGIERPNRLRNPNLPDSERTADRYFDIDAFSTAPQFTLGNSSRNPVRGPGLRNLDIALIKRTSFKDRYVAEF